MERILRLPNNVVVKDEGSIDTLLKQRRSIEEVRKRNSPLEVLKGVDLKNAKLVVGQRKKAGTIELEYGGSMGPFKNELYEIPDLEVNLSPNDSEWKTPLKVMHYDLVEGSEKVTIDVFFDETSGEYWKNYGKEEAIDIIVRKNLMKALHEKNWKWDIFGGWSAVK